MNSIKCSLVASVAAVSLLTGAAVQAQAYPAKPVRFVVTYPAGGSSDVMARIIGKKLTELWGQQVLVESRPGAAGAVGMEYAAKQAPDGYTFLLGNFGPVLANPLLTKVKYNVDKDFVPVSQITRAANILVTPNTLPVKNVQELVALAKKNPGMTYATSGQRTPFTPELPTLAESGLKGFDAANWWGIMFPAGVQKSMIDKVSSDLKIALTDADVKKNLGTMAIEAVYKSPEEFAAFIQSERKAWGEVISAAKISGIQ